MTIYELKALNIRNGGCWFDKSTMKNHGQTLKSFWIRNDKKRKAVVLTDKHSGQSQWFDSTTGRAIHL